MRRSIMLGILSVTATLVVAAPAQASTNCTWTWSDLPLPANKSYARVYASDGHGAYAGVAGGAWPQKQEAVVWRNGTVTPLGVAFGADTRVWDINSDGVVVGAAGGVPVRYRAGQWEHLPMPAGYNSGAGMYVNDNGDIAGAVGIGTLVLWPATGGYQTVAAPIVTSYAQPAAIASDGTVGFWMNDNWYQRSAGFLRRPDGTWIRMTSPSPAGGAGVVALNDDIVVGTDGSAGSDMIEWDWAGAIVRTYPGVSPIDVNAEGQILGVDTGLGIWRSGVREAQLPSPVVDAYVTGIDIDDDGAVIGQLSALDGWWSRPVVAHCV